MRTVSLSSLRWTVRDASGSARIPAVVPGCVHTDLLRAGRIPDPFWGTNEAALQWIEEREYVRRTAYGPLQHEVCPEQVLMPA